MSTVEDHRAQARATWAAGDWDGEFWKLVTPVGQAVLERAAVESGQRQLDVGTVTGLDPTPELLDHAHRRAVEAGVEVEWVEGDAQDLPFDDRSFDRVISTFGAMFAPNHGRAAAELVRVCDSPGRVLMTTWTDDGFAGELFQLTGSMLPAPPSGAQPPALWGDEQHILDTFEAAGASPSLERMTVKFSFDSVQDTVRHYAEGFGPFVMARQVLEPEGRWQEFLDAFGELVAGFNIATDGTATVPSEYLIITVRR
jgi:SAM-dependent methyltransferase